MQTNIEFHTVLEHFVKFYLINSGAFGPWAPLSKTGHISPPDTEKGTYTHILVVVKIFRRASNVLVSDFSGFLRFLDGLGSSGRLVGKIPCGSAHAHVCACTWHRWGKHKLRNPVRELVCTTVCIACMREFHTRERVLAHITASSPKCRGVYLEVRPDLDITAEEIKCLEREAYNNEHCYFGS